MTERLAQKLKDLPDTSGVYIMRSATGQILYVGKAKVLKNRVRQYFQNGSIKTTKVIVMVQKIADFDYIITQNEVEALVLENNLIKKHKPPYNILLKDDKSYPFIKINPKEAFPKIEVVRKLKPDGAKYFGPYMQGVTTNDIFEVIRSAFPVRTCNLNFDKVAKTHRPCLNFHLQKCLAPCVGNISKEEYKVVIENIIKFLSGNDKNCEDILTKKMMDASDLMEFELAIYYKQRLDTLNKLIRKQIMALPKDLNLDIFAVASNGINFVVSVLVVRGGKMLGAHKESFANYFIEGEGLREYIMRYYDTHSLNADEIVLATQLDDQEVLEKYLSENYKKVAVIVPHQGIRRQLADMAASNANDYLEKSVSAIERLDNASIGAVLQLQQQLGLKAMPLRIECFDISHISGTDKVASMTVFTSGEADKKQYRHFKIKTVEGNNDFECMREVLSRRFAKLKDEKFGARPDLIVVDGGRGQLSYAADAAREAGVDITIIALAERLEEIFVVGQDTPIVLPMRNYGLKLLQRLRDEAHRFAISYHQKLRGQRQTKSVLSEIDGMGEKRIKALYNHFKTISAIKAASVAELCQVEGFSKNFSARVYNFFHK